MYRGENGSGNEASLAEIMAPKYGRPDCWWVGRDFPRIARRSWANHWELTVPDFWTLIADRNASFLAILGDPVSGVAMAPEMGHS